MASKTFYSNKYDARQLRLELTQYQDIATNRSRIHWKFISAGSTADATLYLVYATTIKINGTQVYYKGDTQWYGNGTPERPTKVFPAAEGYEEGDIWVTHNNDGSLSVPIYFYTGVFASKYKKDYGGTFTLDKIPRGATLSAAPNFNDEGNPTITYSNPAGNAVSSLQACIADVNGSTIYVPYRDISKTGTSYTFSLTAAERETLRKATPNNNNLSVKFYVKTTIAGNTFYSNVQKTMSITNGSPTLSPTVVDSNETTKALTGDANKLIKYYSNAAYTINGGAVKHSSLSSQKVTHNGIAKTAATGTYNAVENASFSFEVKDSRGNVTTKTVTKTLINYIKLTCNQKVHISVEGDATVSISGNYFNGTFGATSNNLTVQYRYKVNGGEYSAWADAPKMVDGNSFTATAFIEGLDYKTSYIFQSRAMDRINTGGVTTSEINTKAMPVFDWGENDFAFNVPMAVNVNEAVAFKVDEDDTSSYVQSLPTYNRTYALSSNMIITNLGTFGRATSSSKRYKEEIEDIKDSSLDPHKVLSIPVRQFKYNKKNVPIDKEKDDLYIGFIAEEVEEVFPAAAEYNENGEVEMWNIKVLFPALLKVVQEQQQEIEALKEKLGG